MGWFYQAGGAHRSSWCCWWLGKASLSVGWLFLHGCTLWTRSLTSCRRKHILDVITYRHFTYSVCQLLYIYTCSSWVPPPQKGEGAGWVCKQQLYRYTSNFWTQTPDSNENKLSGNLTPGCSSSSCTNQPFELVVFFFLLFYTIHSHTYMYMSNAN